MPRAGGRRTNATEKPVGAPLWATIRPDFLHALSLGQAQHFCDSWIARLDAAVEAAEEDLEADLPVPDLPHLRDMSQSVHMLRFWWLPLKTQPPADAASDYLRRWIEIETKLHWIMAWMVSEPPAGKVIEWERGAPVREFNEASVEPTSMRDHRIRVRGLAKRLEELTTSPSFATLVELRLSTYDPVTTEASPASVLDKAIEDQIGRDFGPLPIAPRPKRTSLGTELRRRFQLALDHPERHQLEQGLERITPAQASLVRTLYADKGDWKTLQHMEGKKRKRASLTTNVGGGKLSALRKAAVNALIREVPELRWYSHERFYS